MSFDRRTIIGAIGLALAIGGCAPVDAGFGEALKYDMALQTVNPDGAAPRPGAAQPGDSAVRGAKASENYRKGTVKQPVPMSVSGGSSGSSGSSGSGGPQ